jgi:hypothetical protein
MHLRAGCYQINGHNKSIRKKQNSSDSAADASVETAESHRKARRQCSFNVNSGNHAHRLTQNILYKAL